MYIQENQALWFYNGDGPDNVTKNCPASPADAKWSNNEQLNYLVEKFEPIKHLCMGLVGGNHEERSKKGADFDFTEELSARLGIDYYGYEMFWVIGRRGEDGNGVTFSGYNNHSGSYNKNTGLTVNAIIRDWSWLEGVDIVAKGHDHNVGVTPHATMAIETRSNAVKEKVRWIWSAGSFLERAKSYAAKRPYAPKPSIYYSLLLHMNKNKDVDTVQHRLRR
jgi:hypothetical protein